MIRRFALVAVVGVLLLAPSAKADEAARGVSLDPTLRGSGALYDASPQRRSSMLSVFLDFPAVYWRWGGAPFGVGARFYLPLLHDGFVPTINDSFGVEVGGDLIAIGSQNFVFGLGIPVEAMWALHFFPKFAMYLKVGFALELHFGTWCAGNSCNNGNVLDWGFTAAVGGWFKLTDSLWLRFEAGYPGLKVGLGFPL